MAGRVCGLYDIAAGLDSPQSPSQPPASLKLAIKARQLKAKPCNAINCFFAIIWWYHNNNLPTAGWLACGLTRRNGDGESHEFAWSYTQKISFDILALQVLFLLYLLYL